MFTNKYNDRNNIIGIAVRNLRKDLHVSQRELAERLEKVGIVMDKNAVQRIEDGKRFVTDIELIGFSKLFERTPEEMIKISMKQH